VVQHHHLCDGNDMTLITFEDGKAVFRDGKVGTEQACCCEEGEVCCNPDCGFAWPVDFTPDAGMDAAFTAFLEGQGHTNVEFTQDAAAGTAAWSSDCCVSDPSSTSSFTVTGSIAGTPQSVTFYVSPCVTSKTEGTNCVEGLTAQECSDLSGTITSAASCSPDPCPSECCVERWTSDAPGDPCPAGFTFLNTTSTGFTNCYRQTVIESPDECSLEGSFVPDPPATGVYSWGVQNCYENPLP